MWCGMALCERKQSLLMAFLGVEVLFTEAFKEKQLPFWLILAPLLVASSEGCEVRREHPLFRLCILSPLL